PTSSMARCKLTSAARRDFSAAVCCFRRWRSSLFRAFSSVTSGLSVKRSVVMAGLLLPDKSDISVQNAFLDRLELPAVDLRIDENSQALGVVVLFPGYERFGSLPCEVGVDVFPRFGKCGNRVVFKL